MFHDEQRILRFFCDLPLNLTYFSPTTTALRRTSFKTASNEETVGSCACLVDHGWGLVDKRLTLLSEVIRLRVFHERIQLWRHRTSSTFS